MRPTKKEIVEGFREAIEGGNNKNLLLAVLSAIDTYKNPNPYDADSPLPRWLHTAFRDAVLRGAYGYVRSWDEIFGKPVKKGAKIKQKILRNALTRHVIQRVEELSLQGKSKPDLFRQVGREMKDIAGLAVSGKLVDKIYYDPANKILRRVVRESLLQTFKTS